MEEVIDVSVAERRFPSISYSVARRRNEIGIRMAPGVQHSQNVRYMWGTLAAVYFRPCLWIGG